MIVDRNLVDVDEKLLEAMAGRYETLDFVLSRAPDTRISHKALVQGAKDPRSIRLLLDKRSGDAPITEDIIIGATESRIEGGFQESVKAIVHRTGSAPITENVFRAALCNFQVASFPWLHEQRPDLDIVVEDMFNSICQDVEIPAMKKLFAYHGFVALQGDSDDGDDEFIPTSLLDKLPYSRELKDNYGFDELVKCLAEAEEDLPLPDVQRKAEIIVERSGLAALEPFLKSNPKIVISETLVQAAKRNVMANQDELMALLEEHKAR
ncbi:hypothetical protein N7527_005565 [Penicillium freii]|nr:hypothetical protein N7527_005565 [Penicillium freii]